MLVLTLTVCTAAIIVDVVNTISTTYYRVWFITNANSYKNRITHSSSCELRQLAGLCRAEQSSATLFR